MNRNNTLASEIPFHRRRLLQAVPAALALPYATALAATRPARAEETASAENGGLSKELIIRSANPPNAEPPLDKLVQSWLTPVERFYVRSHAPAPPIDPAQFRLKVEGLVRRPKELSLAELRGRFHRVETIATMCCAGNRRQEHSAVKMIDGVQWDSAALGNALWSGFRLADLLRLLELKPEAKHVWFEGLDPHEKKGRTILFGGSIPLARAMAPPAGAEPLLVDRMNGVPLTADHGFPLRTVTPGFIGARSVKWLGKIVVSDRPSDNYYVSRAYRLVTESTDNAWSKAAPLMSLPLQSFACSVTPLPATKGRRAGALRVRGYALAAGDGDGLLRSVEISLDGGRLWKKARIVSNQRRYCWSLWEADVRPSGPNPELLVRAVDTYGRTQPAEVAWNMKGYMFNAWQRLKLPG